METIENLRERIDSIDDELLALLHRRLSIVRKIGEYKTRRGLPIMDLRRETEILRRMRGSGDICLDVATTGIFREILSQSRRAQQQAIEELRGASRIVSA